jgi:hypothetical protein
MNITHLVHMATTSAEETFSGEDQINKIDLLYSGSRNVLEQCGEGLENVLFTSSGVAYGVNTKLLKSENDFTRPDTTDIGSALGVGKLISEYLIAYFASKYGYSYSIARCFAFAGEYRLLVDFCCVCAVGHSGWITWDRADCCAHHPANRRDDIGAVCCTGAETGCVDIRATTDCDWIDGYQRSG